MREKRLRKPSRAAGSGIRSSIRYGHGFTHEILSLSELRLLKQRGLRLKRVC